MKKIFLLVSLLVLFSMLLSACGGETATPTEAPAPVEPTEAPTEAPTEVPEPEPTEAPEEPQAVEPEAFDPAFFEENYSTMLANMQGYNTIQADGLMEELVGDSPPFLLDVRTTAEVEENGHITGAVHMPLENLTQAMNMLPGSDDPIVVYCGSGWRATIAMTSLHGMGWRNVRALKTSFADWVEAGNPVTEGLPGPAPANMMAYPQPLIDIFDASMAIYGVKPYGGIDAEGLNTALVENPDMIVIDVRTPGELEEKGTIDTGDVEFIAIPLEDFIAKQDMWPTDLDAQITIYCGSGHRSTMALAILGSYGYTDVSSLKGGFGGWADGGYPIVGGAMPELSQIDINFQTMLENMEKYNTIIADGLMEELVGDNPPFLLDVRTTAEVEENGHITGAAHMPLENLTQALNMLPGPDDPIVVYCGSGWRATIAMTALHGMGWTNIRALKTPFADWVAAGNPVTEGLPGPFPANMMAYPPELTEPFDFAMAIYGVKPFGVITADDLNLELAENADLVLIDVRTTGEVEEQGYIASDNWIHIPLEEFMARKAEWPAADARVAVYCGSGHRSTMALTMLGANGYPNVSSLKGGFGGWVSAGYPVAGAMASFAANYQMMLETMEGYNTIIADGLMEQMVADEPPFLLDVRTTAEVEENGHIEGAVHIPLNELAQNLDSLPAYTTPIVTYCGSGWRATIAMTALYGMGWENVKALKTPFADWVEAGNPVVEGLPEPSMVQSMVEFDPAMVAALDAMLQVYGVKPFGVIDAEGLNTALVENPELIVIDVRKESELAEKGVIDTGDVELITIPIESFIAEMSQWPASDSEIAVYCGSGHRSTMALAMLGTFGYETVSSLKGGFGDWEEAGFPVAEFAAP
jgi:rhodanese-related sulfurtransferase